jgi:hypothetical protein
MIDDPEGTGTDPDDWFDPEGEGLAGDGGRGGAHDEPGENWFDGGPAEPTAASSVAALWNRLSPPQQLGAVVGALLAIIVIGLAAGGVFSSSGKGQSPIVVPPPVTTFPKTTPTTTPVVTTPATTTTAAKTTGTLKSGDRGPAVVSLQRRLIALGYGIGKADGVYGPATVRAITAFQSSSGLAADGVAGPATLNALAAAGH